MANKEVNIFFKVDGLDGYITDLGDLKNALGQAEASTSDLSRAQSDLENDFDNLQNKLDTLEGGVKVLAGSAEIAAGALGLLGVENEFFQEIEENVINIIALAEGAINMAEGVRLLAENQRLAAIAQRAFNIAANANPYVLLATALTTAAGILLVWKMNAEDALPPTEDLANEIDRIADEKNVVDIDKLVDRIDALRRAAFGDDRSDVDNAIELIAEVTSAIEESKERETALFQEASQVEDEIFQERLRNSQNYTDEELDQRIKANQEKLDSDELTEESRTFLESVQQALRFRQAVRAEQDLQFQLTEELRAGVEARDKIIADANEEFFENPRIEPIKDELEAVNLLAESWRQYYDLRKDEDKELAESTTENVGGAKEQVESFADEYFKAFNAVVEEPKKAAELLKRDFTAAISFVGNLNAIFSKDNEKRAERNFKLQKALSLSNAIINTAEGVTTALTDKTQPSTILRLAQTAAVAAAGAAQIATIARQKFSPEGSTDTSIATPSISPQNAINYNFDQNAGAEITAGGQGNTNVVQPLQAYVLVNDVNNAQQANQQIQNLSRL